MPGTLRINNNNEDVDRTMINFNGPIKEFIKTLRLLEEFLGKETKVSDINYRGNYPLTPARHRMRGKLTVIK